MTITIGKLVPALALAASALASHANASDPSEGGQTITVRVSALRNTNGKLACRLYARSEGFPSEATHLMEQKTPVEAKSQSCKFARLTPGTYAVAVMHDENDNGKLDTNFFGAPTEGYGTSNNKKHAFSAPTWDDARFALLAGKDATLDVQLYY
jgi:uncharacterized protein (DUF2141 family)